MKQYLLAPLAILSALLWTCGCGNDKTDEQVPGPTHDGSNVTAVTVGGAVASKGGLSAEGFFFVRDQNNAGVAIFSDDIAIEESLDGVTWQPVDTIFSDGSGSLPVATALVLDYSGTMTNGTSIPDMEAAALAFVGNMGDGDTAEIIKFSYRVRMLQTFTADRFALENAISGEFPDAGFTSSLFDAVQRAIADAALQESPRAVIALTDGSDNSSSADRTAVIADAQSQAVPVFTVGLGSRVYEFDVMDIAYRTGTFYYSAATSADLAEIYGSISGLLRRAVKVQWFSPFASGTVQCRATITYRTPTAIYSTNRTFSYTR